VARPPSASKCATARELITLHDIIDTDTFVSSPSLLTLALGKDIHGEPMVTDLARSPPSGGRRHRRGQVVGLNSMIVSLAYKALPTTADADERSKMVELKSTRTSRTCSIHRHRSEARLPTRSLGGGGNGNRYPTLPSRGAHMINTMRC